MHLLHYILLVVLALHAGVKIRALETGGKEWALKPIVRPPVPTISETLDNPIDAFIGKSLFDAGLTFSPEADRRTLGRRLYFDVIGLPPTPAELESFVRDDNRNAVERLIDRLLNSSQYGEKWARHWLDIVRFAETHGFEMNQPRANAWPYRDYVIAAFNHDKPYNQFVLEQIAGDALGVDEATGFLVAGPWDQVKSPDPVLTANQRADELHDIVSTTSSTFLGLTVGCARCHDHKFDPIPQKDYYAIKAVFEGVQHGERPRRDGKHDKGRETEIAQLNRELSELDERLERLEPMAGTAPNSRVAVNAKKNVERFLPIMARKIRFTVMQTSGGEPCVDELEVFTSRGRNVALASQGTKARASSVYPNSEIHRVEHINDGRYGNSRSWISREPGRGWIELELPEPTEISKIIWARDREGQFSDRLATDYRIEVRTPDDEWRVIASAVDRVKPGTILAAGAETANLMTRRSELEARLRNLSSKPMAYAGTFKENPDSTPRLNRGDPMQPREAIAPGALEAIPVRFRESGSDLTEDQRRRLAFAHWITDTNNPLTARVLVNRLWQYHFGVGIVSTPSDFGANGARPSHPELLDWLAAELMEHGWSIKHIQRLILESRTFRQSSAATEQGLRADVGTRLLWRFPGRRLDAEAIRDAILATTGSLDRRSGGPGFSFFEPNENYVRVYNPRASWPNHTFRRMVYGTVVRQRPDGVFGVFDCPDAGQIAPKRTSSTTPLQALNLLNSEFILQQAISWADSLHERFPDKIELQVQQAFTRAFLRPPSADELAAALDLVSKEGLPILCRALLNANEFVYLF